MAGPDWALLVLVVYPLVQIPLIFYLARWFDLDGEAPVATPGRAFWTGQAAEEDPSRPPVARPGRCRRCGTDNDPSFTFCKQCVSRL